MKQKLFIVFLLLFVFCSHISAEFIVHTIYFQPTDAPPLAKMEKRVSDYSLLSQDLYMREMNRHGFDEKTYRLEKTDIGNVRVHLVKGNNIAAHYLTDTVNRVFAELPNKFNPDTAPWHKLDTIRVIVVGGLTLIDNWAVGVGWPRTTVVVMVDPACLRVAVHISINTTLHTNLVTALDYTIAKGATTA